MTLSLRDVLALPVMAQARPELVHGEALVDRPVRWVHTSEIYEIAPLLKGRELLLTTGLGLVRATPAQQASYVADLAERGVTALVLELGRTFLTTPQALVVAAREHDLALVALHGVVPFVEVTETVHQLLLDAELVQRRLADTVTTELTEALLLSTGLGGVVQRMAALGGGPYVLRSADGRVVAASEGADSAAESLSSGTAVDSHPVDVLATRWGELLAYGPPDDRRRTVLERGAVAVALELSRSGAAGTARVAGRELLRDAALNRLGSLADLTARAEALGLVMRPGHQLLALCVTPESSDALPAVVGAATAASRQVLGAAALVADVEGDVVAVAVVARTIEPDGVRSLVERFAEQLEARLPARRTTVTAGPVGSDVASLAASVVAAREASRLARRLGSHPRVLLAADVGVHRLLSRLVEHAELETFLDEQIGALLVHDARLGRDLVRTLEAYFDHGLSKTRTAAALGVRRQTLYARLERIERLLGGLDLHRRERRTALDLALVAWRLRGSAVGQGRRRR